MDNLKEIRWKQRFENFSKAYELLKRTLQIGEPSEAEKAGTIQFYEIAFELSWKLMRDYLQSEGFIVKSPRETIKKANEMDILNDAYVWIDALDDRNLTTHIYDEEIADEILERIRLKYFPEIEKLYSFFVERL
jgi:nucleotidyltransferase substrate binding protein (TIGR01987 family)